MELLTDIVWAVAPGATSSTRPAMLIQALDRMGFVEREARYWHHGRRQSTDASTKLNHLAYRTRKWIGRPGKVLAVLSPVVPVDSSGPYWMDMYDDWSIAPDINPISRICASITYAELRRSNRSCITVNSVYMAKKLNVSLSRVIPNGVDARLGGLPTTGDARPRLIVFGKFFAGRTDFELLKDLVRAGAFEEVILGDPGTSREMAQFTKWVNGCGYSPKVRFENWVSIDHLRSLVGPRTVAAVPHKVTDYTLSQDLMKVYTFQALGIPVICPSLLWPPHLSKVHALLLGPGVSQDLGFASDWLAEQRPTLEWRKNFVNKNSWDARARDVVGIL